MPAPRVLCCHDRRITADCSRNGDGKRRPSRQTSAPACRTAAPASASVTRPAVARPSQRSSNARPRATADDRIRPSVAGEPTTPAARQVDHDSTAWPSPVLSTSATASLSRCKPSASSARRTPLRRTEKRLRLMERKGELLPSSRAHRRWGLCRGGRRALSEQLINVNPPHSNSPTDADRGQFAVVDPLSRLCGYPNCRCGL